MPILLMCDFGRECDHWCASWFRVGDRNPESFMFYWHSTNNIKYSKFTFEYYVKHFSPK